MTDGHYTFNRELHTFWDIYRYHPTPNYINYSVVWNNNIPGLSIHSYEPYRDNHILNFESYDGTYHFIYTIFYPNFLSAEDVYKRQHYQQSTFTNLMIRQIGRRNMKVLSIHLSIFRRWRRITGPHSRSQ